MKRIMLQIPPLGAGLAPQAPTTQQAPMTQQQAPMTQQQLPMTQHAPMTQQALMTQQQAPMTQQQAPITQQQAPMTQQVPMTQQDPMTQQQAPMTQQQAPMTQQQDPMTASAILAMTQAALRHMGQAAFMPQTPQTEPVGQMPHTPGQTLPQVPNPQMPNRMPAAYRRRYTHPLAGGKMPRTPLRGAAAACAGPPRPQLPNPKTPNTPPTVGQMPQLGPQPLPQVPDLQALPVTEPASMAQQA